jgi:hypothetical protein
LSFITCSQDESQVDKISLDNKPGDLIGVDSENEEMKEYFSSKNKQDKPVEPIDEDLSSDYEMI